MPYAKVSSVNLGVEVQLNEDSYFYLEDIAFIISQPGAKALQCVAVEAKSSGKKGLGLLGVTEIDPHTGKAIGRLDNPNDYVALICPPFTEPPGDFLANP